MSFKLLLYIFFIHERVCTAVVGGAAIDEKIYCLHQKERKVLNGPGVHTV